MTLISIIRIQGISQITKTQITLYRNKENQHLEKYYALLSYLVQ
jgi:hypothetical protein